LYDVEIREKAEEPRASNRQRLVVDSWGPGAKLRTVLPGMRKWDPSRALRNVGRSAASWTILVALSMDLLSVREPVVLVLRRAPVRAVCATVLAAPGLALIFAFIVAVPVAAVHSLVRFIGRTRRGLRFAWPLPLLALAWFVISDVTPHPLAQSMGLAESRAIVLILFGALLVLATGVTRIRSNVPRLVAGTVLGGLTFGLYIMLPPSVHREPRDMAWLSCVVSVAALLYPLRRRITAASQTMVARGFGLFCAVSFAGLLLSSWVSPNWRVYARDYGAFTERLGRFSRTLLDLDGDGYSAVLWGTDCDDMDPLRNPGMGEVIGHDRNCNGIVRPAVSTPAQRGLAVAVGEPDLAVGVIDRVVLVTIDCLRNDVVTPEVMPNLTSFATRSLRFTKLYGGGTRTATSLPLMLRGAYSLTPVAALLTAEHVSTSVVFGYKHPTIGGNVLHGFASVKRPDENDHRFRATEVTNFALDDLRSPDNATSHFLWVHYFDAHGPRTLRVLPPGTPKFAPLAHEDPDSSLYQSQIAYIDAELGRLLEGIEKTGQPGKTLIIVSSDHGEGFGLHAMYEHGESAFEEVTHVPGFLMAPGIVPGHYDHVASHRDIAATIVGAFGLVAKNPQVEEFGRSWLRLRAAPSAVLHDFVITYSAAEHVQMWSSAPMMIRTDDHTKFAVAYRDGLQRLYHLDSPDAEWRDLAPWFPAEVAKDRGELELYRDIDSQPP
jgi:arylsulfatase A-like enzyme